MAIMIQRDIKLDVFVFTYNSLIDSYCLRGEIDKAKKVFNMMVDKGCESDLHS